MMRFLSKIIFLPIFFVLFSCQMVTRDGNPMSVGRLQDFNRKLVKGGDFWITTYQKISNPYASYVFYIEGDGAAFNGKYQVSHNPTPKRQDFLKLAILDERPNVVYVARPCQYTPMSMNPKCNNSYWTHKRMSEDSVEAINDVINTINDKKKPFSLVGFSGGGGMAVLVAARNPLVKDILTISANLDHVAFTKHHNVTPMVGSLNPIDYAMSIKEIPQIHVSGGKDKTIPVFIADKYVEISNSPCVKQKIIPEQAHSRNWNYIWPYLLDIPITCDSISE